MRNLKSLITTGSTLCLFVGLLTVPAQAEIRPLPVKNFACQVQAKNGIQGVVRLQTDSRQLAMAGAKSVNAKTLNGEYSTVLSVVECILLPSEKFKDSAIQRFLDNTAS